MGETIFIVVIIILLLVYLLAQDSKKETTRERYGDAVSGLAQMAAGSVSKIARDISEPADKKKIRKAKEKIAWMNYNILHNYSRVSLDKDKDINDQSFLKINDEFAAALNTLGLDHDTWKKVAKDFFYMGVIYKTSNRKVNQEMKKNDKYDRQSIIDSLDEQGYGTDYFGHNYKHQIIDALNNFNIEIDDFIKYGDTVIDMYELMNNNLYKDYGLMIINQ